MQWLNDFFINSTNDNTLVMGDYNYFLVVLSITLAAVASFFALHFASIAKHIVVQKYKNIALISGSFIMAGGIWSMHFVGMLAFNMGHPIAYDPLLTALSIIPSVPASYVTLKKLIQPRLTIWQLLINGVLVGVGIGAMHYIGMAAMIMDVELKYDPTWFSFSLVIAVVLAFVALSTHYYVIRIWPKMNPKWVSAISAGIMGTAISGMHYAGMSGARYIAPDHLSMSHMNHISDTSTNYLSLVVAVITLLLSILAANIASQLRYRQLLLEKTASEVRLKTTLDTAIDGIITIDGNGIVKEFNKAAVHLFGWQETDIIGRSFDILFPKKYSDEFHDFLLQYRTTGKKSISGTEREIYATNKNGRLFPIRIGVGRVDIIDSETLFVAFISDISARKQMEETIRNSEKQYSSLIKNIPGASFRCLMDKSWTEIFVSDAIYDITGWQATDFYSRTVALAKLIHPDDDDRVSNTIKESAQEHKTYKIEYRLKHKEGHFVWVIENGSVIHNEDGIPEWIDGVILDISQRIEIENELRQAKVKAEASAESKALFLANMSHEIRTPMNAIIGFSDILLESDTSAENKKHLITISKSSRSLLHLLNDILDSAKLDKNKLELDMQNFVLANTVDTVISTLWLQARSKGLELHFDIDPDVAIAYHGAEDRIRQVLMNLLGNAIKFTEIGSVTLTVSKEDDNVRFSIQDSGIGIPEERLKSIFDPFTQADASMSRRFGGTGLGTSISKQLVDLMGGEINVTSKLGQGSCFYFDLPLKESELPIEKKLTQQAVITPKKILLADDVEQNLTLLTLLLKRQNHGIFLAKDGLEAVKQFKSIQPDIILMDIQMPNMDGLTATQVIRSYEAEHKLDRTPIIALTANVLLEDKLEAEHAGMDGFANKPIDFHSLVEEMARVLDESPTLIEKETANYEVAKSKNDQINLEKGLSLWNDMSVYLTELDKFAHQYSHLVSTLSDYLSTQKYHELKTLSHTVKGTAGNLAMLPISNLMAKIECSATSQKHEKCQQNIEYLSDLFTKFIEELKSLTSQLKKNETKSENSYQIKLHINELLSLLDELIHSANLGEIDETKINLFIENVSQNMKRQAIEASNSIINFEFTNAINALTSLKEQILQEAGE